MDFKTWLIQYEGRNSRRGDLAYDVNRDNRFPKGSDKAVFLNYLRHIRKAHPDAMATFRETFRAYEAWRRRNLDESLMAENARLEAKLRELEGLEQQTGLD
ncbi:YozE family protein [Planococcus plakortidis]